jgi:glycosyltransferase AglI
MISVVIPVFNDPDGLRETVTSLAGQTLPQSQFEIVIVDNGSTDGTFEVAQLLAVHSPGFVIAERERAYRSSYAARNRGIRRARGDIICFVDADMTVPPAYLQGVRDALASGIDYLGCRVMLYADRATTAAQYNQAFGFRVQEYLLKDHFAPTCCLSVRRAVLERVGFFDARLESGGDLEFGGRVHAAGFHQDYAPDIVLRHPARTTFRALLNKSRRTARGLAQLHHYHPGRYDGAVRRLLTWRAYMPTRPRTIQQRYAAIGSRVSGGAAILISLWSLPLRWARPFAFLRERIRLNRSSRAAATAEAGPGEFPMDRTTLR